MKEFSAKNAAFEALKSVYLDGAYSSIELDRVITSVPDSYRGYVTALVYSVLENDVKITFILDKLISKKPKPGIYLVLKMGAAEILNFKRNDALVINEYVAFVKTRFKGADGFVNAVLRKVKSVDVPKGNSAEEISVRFSVPLFAVKRYIKDYGLDETIKMLSSEPIKMTHIRSISPRVTKDGLKVLLEKTGATYTETEYGFFIGRNSLKNLDGGIYTPQGISSIIAANFYAEGLEGNITAADLCAAPGGKAVLLKELLPDTDITAADIHPHRVSLIRSYAAKAGAKLNILVNDAVEFREDFKDKFDLLVLDVPCTGSGLVKSSPDILLFKEENDVKSLSSLQKNILQTCSAYVKKGGRLCYSTCSVFKEENEEVTREFLENNPEFKILDEKTIMPDGEKDGFYMFKAVRV